MSYLIFIPLAFKCKSDPLSTCHVKIGLHVPIHLMCKTCFWQPYLYLYVNNCFMGDLYEGNSKVTMHVLSVSIKLLIVLCAKVIKQNI